ncbi:MAG: glutamate--tRNA ligase, partial [Gammaproteobacteria bacterium]
KDVHRAASAFNTEKLLWLNQHYIKPSDPAHIAHHVSWHMGRLGIDPAQGPDLADVVEALRERAKTLVEMAQAATFFYHDFESYEEKSAAKHLTGEVLEALSSLHVSLIMLTPWSPEAIHQLISEVAGKHDLTMGKLAQPLRVAVTGKAASPPIDVTVHLLGRETTLLRLEKALAHIRASDRKAD